MLSYYLALADISRDCHAKNIAWQSAEPYEFYTPAAIERVDRILARAAQLLDEVSWAGAGPAWKTRWPCGSLQTAGGSLLQRLGLSAHLLTRCQSA